MGSPIDWPGLLKWSTKYHDGTSDVSKFKQLSEEDRKFLEGALEEAFGQIEDPNKVMVEAVQQLQAPDRTSESLLTALEVIDRCCDDPDCARNCEHLGAVQAVLDTLRESSEKGFVGGEAEVCRRAAEILALLCANNPQIQQAAAGRGALELLIGVVSTAEPASEPRLKCLRALAALVRGEESLKKAFLNKHGGQALLVAALKPEGGLKVREKAAQMARALLDSEQLAKDLDLESLARTLFPTAHGGDGLLEHGDSEETTLQYAETVASFALRVATAVAAAGTEIKAKLRGPLSEALKARWAQLRGATDREAVKEELGLLLQAAKLLA